ncbi:uncharacterized protein sowahd [Electrophorus electricus]|uniref:Uncharacterized protein n=1 Tax=Electrophorus electricus TaxID=8005 RepID=A0A4W4FYJ9_ELEEL|nr:uncharacterized protein sowahd [Electrophorus electricus]XP_026874343.1 uncharacterized protein sowahd [Electrophorus electricus]
MYENNNICSLSESSPNGSETPAQSQMDGDDLNLEVQRHTETTISCHVSVLASSTGAVSRHCHASLQERASKVGARSLPLALNASTRRSRFQRQFETSEQKTSLDSTDKGSLTPAMRKKYLKDLFLNYKSHSGLSNILSLQSASESWGAEEDSALWALEPLEHAWMLSVVDGNLDTIVEFLSEDPSLLTRKDFVSGYTALHWLAKNGNHETLINLLKHAEKQGVPVNVNLKGSGGLTPLHIAAMQSQYMVIKVLVGAFSADVDVMDYSGKRPWQYLKGNVSPEIKELLGAWDDEHTYCKLNFNNNRECVELSVEECPKNTDEVDSFSRTHRWGLSSFVKRLTPFFSRGKN